MTDCQIANANIRAAVDATAQIETARGIGRAGAEYTLRAYAKLTYSNPTMEVERKQ